MSSRRDTLCPICRARLGTGLGAFLRSAAILHLFCVVCTAGLWLPVWIYITLKKRQNRICLECGTDLDEGEIA